MQDQKRKVSCVLLGLPSDVLEEAGIDAGSLLEISAEKGLIFIAAVGKDSIDDFVCDGDCENCPVNRTDCDGNCADCPCGEHCE